MILGLIGLGRMGSAMARRIVATGHDLLIWNRTPAKSAALEAQGARHAHLAADVLRKADIILLMTDAAGSQAVLADVPDMTGRIVVLMGTHAPAAIARLCEQVRQAGGRALDAPVLGTVAPAAAGQLVVLVGGDRGDMETVRPVLDLLARRIVHVGEIGSATSMKLAHNLLLSTYWTILGEALALGEASGLDRSVMLDILTDSAAANGVLALKTPALLGQPAPIAFDIRGMAGELAATCEIADSLGLALPVTTLAHDLARHAVAVGGGGRDVAATAEYAAQDARSQQRRMDATHPAKRTN